jgi:hypothetical protein
MRYEAGQQCLNGTNISKVVENCGKTIDILVPRSLSCWKLITVNALMRSYRRLVG